MVVTGLNLYGGRIEIAKQPCGLLADGKKLSSIVGVEECSLIPSSSSYLMDHKRFVTNICLYLHYWGGRQASYRTYCASQPYMAGSFDDNEC